MKPFKDVQIEALRTLEKMEHRIIKLYRDKGNHDWIHDLENELNTLKLFFNETSKRIRALEISDHSESYVNNDLREQLRKTKQILSDRGFTEKDLQFYDISESSREYKEMIRRNSIIQAKQDFNL